MAREKGIFIHYGLEPSGTWLIRNWDKKGLPIVIIQAVGDFGLPTMMGGRVWGLSQYVYYETMWLSGVLWSRWFGNVRLFKLQISNLIYPAFLSHSLVFYSQHSRGRTYHHCNNYKTIHESRQNTIFLPGRNSNSSRFSASASILILLVGRNRELACDYFLSLQYLSPLCCAIR